MLAGKLDVKNAGSKVRWEDCRQESRMGKIDVSKVGWEGLPAANQMGRLLGANFDGKTAESDGKDCQQESQMGRLLAARCWSVKNIKLF